MNNWDAQLIHTVSDLADFISGKTLKSTELLEKASRRLTPYLRSIVDLGLIHPKPVRWTESERAYVRPEGTLVVSVDSSGLTANTLSSPMAISGHIAEVRLKSVDISRDFLRFNILREAKRQKDLCGKPSHLTELFDSVKTWKINLPTMAEQVSLVMAVSKAEEVIVAQEAACTALRVAIAEKFLSVFGKSVLNNPQMVQFVPLGTVAEVKLGRRFKLELVSDIPTYTKSCLIGLFGDDLFPSSNINPIEASQTIQHRAVASTDLLLDLRTLRVVTSQMLGILDTELFCSDRLVSIQPLTDLLHPIYLLGLLRSDFGVQMMMARRSGPSVPTLTKSAVQCLEVPLPCVELQIEFAEQYQRLMSSLELQTKSLESAIADFNFVLEQSFEAYRS